MNGLPRGEFVTLQGEHLWHGIAAVAKLPHAAELVSRLCRRAIAGIEAHDQPLTPNLCRGPGLDVERIDLGLPASADAGHLADSHLPVSKELDAIGLQVLPAGRR